MLRDGIYTVHQGKEFIISRKDDGRYELASTDEKDIEQYGFKYFVLPDYFIASDGNKYHYANYNKEDFTYTVKEISPSQIGEVYSIHTFGIYKGCKFPIYMERDNQYLLGADDFKVAEELGFETRGQGDFEKWVDKSEVK